MIDVKLAYPFAIGLVAAFNPCGFAMLPTYLAYFVGQDRGSDRSRFDDVRRALVVGLVVTLGFMLVFGVIGVITRNVLTNGAIEDHLPWATIAIGFLLVPLGVAMLAGYEPKLSLPRLQRGGDTRELSSMFLFGVSYAVVSFGCTAPLFISLMATSFTRDGFVDGLATFVAYASGMGLVVMFLTLSVALARVSVARNLRRVMPYVNRVSGGLLVLGGLYVASYGVWEIRVLDDPAGTSENPVQARFTDLGDHLTNWVDHVGEARLGLTLVLLVAGVVAWAILPQLTATRRGQILGGYGVVWVVAEVSNDLELLVRPIGRVAMGLPERVAHWFTDPIRGAVPLEVLVGVLLAAGAAGMVRARDARSASPTPIGGSEAGRADDRDAPTRTP